MSRFFSTIIFSLFLLFQTTSIAEEGEIERLVVPEVQEDNVAHDDAEITEEAVPEEVIAEESNDSQQEIVEDEPADEQTEVAEETPTEETTIEEESQEVHEAPETKEEPSMKEEISEAVLEARRAEEAELREVGAGEEPPAE